ncbi:MbcA/ParS/Xre antitoxin family protein [Devosia algicola]|uniref:MbcA/ParS/Xre antitoxin family protein n=1 Tax=Devosia algicola TaxID=3026418 RepID=A0ABY7YMX0_9HYPH|nr:MbcA/ParS/Xre antitoxin family protein [Devosia algicola]WDR02660.1 MbcA/ParS/Xre antitoxin family protein [Devosia algicola]
MPVQTATTEYVPPNRLDAHDPAQIANVAVKAYAHLADIWKLNNPTGAALIAVSQRTWARIKTEAWTGRLSRDQLLRISAITGLYKALHLYFGETLADQWVHMPNSGPLFGGRTPLDAMIEGGLPTMIDTRTYVDALRGGA